MVQGRNAQADTRHDIRGRPHERTIERVVFSAWIEEYGRKQTLDEKSRLWLQHRFLDELDRRRGLERRWRKVFWLTRYVAFSGSLVLPVLISVGKSIFAVNIAGIAISIVVALATAVEALLRSGRKWRLYRQGADRMASEGTAFFQTLRAYARISEDGRLPLFKERVEDNIRDLHASYVADIDIVASQNVIASSSDRPDEYHSRSTLDQP